MLLQHWTGESQLDEQATSAELLKAWQDWYAKQYPSRPKAELPVPSSESKWKMDELLAHLTSESGSTGTPEQGSSVFSKAQCAKCHRHGSQGENLGPDLTSLARRARRKRKCWNPSFTRPTSSVTNLARRHWLLPLGGRTRGSCCRDPWARKSSGSPTARNARSRNLKSKRSNPAPSPVCLTTYWIPVTLEDISDLFAYLGALPTESVARKPTTETKADTKKADTKRVDTKTTDTRKAEAKKIDPKKKTALQQKR